MRKKVKRNEIINGRIKKNKNIKPKEQNSQSQEAKVIKLKNKKK